MYEYLNRLYSDRESDSASYPAVPMLSLVGSRRSVVGLLTVVTVPTRVRETYCLIGVCLLLDQYPLSFVWCSVAAPVVRSLRLRYRFRLITISMLVCHRFMLQSGAFLRPLHTSAMVLGPALCRGFTPWPAVGPLARGVWITLVICA